VKKIKRSLVVEKQARGSTTTPSVKSQTAHPTKQQQATKVLGSNKSPRRQKVCFEAPDTAISWLVLLSIDWNRNQATRQRQNHLFLLSPASRLVAACILLRSPVLPAVPTTIDDRLATEKSPLKSAEIQFCFLLLIEIRYLSFRRLASSTDCWSTFFFLCFSFPAFRDRSLKSWLFTCRWYNRQKIRLHLVQQQQNISNYLYKYGYKYAINYNERQQL